VLAPPKHRGGDQGPLPFPSAGKNPRAASTCRNICANGSLRAEDKGNLKLEVDVDPQSFL